MSDALALTTYPAAPDGPTYYGQPVLQAPVWIWAVPAYFYVGGTAGAALVLAWAAHRAEGRALRGLVVRCRWIGAAGITLGSGLLVYDLGRPERFLNILRVFRPSSPLSVGSWLLALAGPVAGAAALLARSNGLLGRLGDALGGLGGLLGMPLAGYTGVVLADTAVPLWQEARRALPVAFVGSAMAGTASLLQMMDLTSRERRAAKRFGLIGKAAELGGLLAVEREVSRVERVGRPLKRGVTGLLWNAAKVLSGASLLLALLPGRSRRKRIAGGLMGTASAVCLRFALIEAGKRSAADPQATFLPQRARLGAAEAVPVAPPEQRPRVMAGGPG